MTTHQKHNSNQTKEAVQKRRTVKPVSQGSVALTPTTDLVVLQRTVADPGRARPADILALQRIVGDRAVTRLIQARLTVGPAGDKYEREADRVEEQVMTMPTPVSQQRSAVSGQSPVQRQAEEEEELQTKPLVQRRADGTFEAGSDIERRLAAQTGGGSPLPDEVRAYMEPRFGADFSGVRVHSGGEAAQMSREIQAKAFTHRQDIYLGEGQYAPSSDAGKRLLAHELTHVVQQSGRAMQRNPEGREESQQSVQTAGLSEARPNQPVSSLPQLPPGANLIQAAFWELKADDTYNWHDEDVDNTLYKPTGKTRRRLGGWLGHSYLVYKLRGFVQFSVDFLKPHEATIAELKGDLPAFKDFMLRVGVTVQPVYQPNLTAEQLRYRAAVLAISGIDELRPCFADANKMALLQTILSPEDFTLVRNSKVLYDQYRARYSGMDKPQARSVQPPTEVETNLPFDPACPFATRLQILYDPNAAPQPTISLVDIKELWTAFITRDWTYNAGASPSPYDLILGRARTANCGALAAALIKLVEVLAAKRGVSLPANTKTDSYSNPFVTRSLQHFCDPTIDPATTGTVILSPSVDPTPRRIFFTKHTWALIGGIRYDPLVEETEAMGSIVGEPGVELGGSEPWSVTRSNDWPAVNTTMQLAKSGQAFAGLGLARIEPKPVP